MIQYTSMRAFDSNIHIISRVPDQNGVSKAWYIEEMHHSGREPSIWVQLAHTIFSHYYRLAHWPRGRASPSRAEDLVSIPVFPVSFFPGCVSYQWVSVSVSAQDGTVALGKAHTRSAPSLSSLPKVALETVPIFVWLNTDHSRPWRVECRPLPFSTPLSFRRSVLWCSGLSMFRKFLKPLSTSALPSCRPDVISAVLASEQKIGTPVATLPGARRYRVRGGTDWPGVGVLWLGEIESLICDSYLSVAACTVVGANLSLRQTGMLLGC